jgi:hypothetical protein
MTSDYSTNRNVLPIPSLICFVNSIVDRDKISQNHQSLDIFMHAGTFDALLFRRPDMVT